MCGSFIPGVSKLKLSDILAVIRELRAVLPAQHEHEGLPPIQVNVVRLCPRPVAVGLSSIPQKHGGALLTGGVPGHKGANT